MHDITVCLETMGAHPEHDGHTPNALTTEKGDSPHVRRRTIVSRLQANDTSALHDLAREYATELGSIALSITGSHDLAQDIFQDILVKVWESRATLHEVHDLTGFLRRLTRHRAIDVFRHERSQHRLAERFFNAHAGDIPLVHNLGAEEIDAADLRALVLRILQSVAPRCRQIFVMRAEGGMSYAEIAETLGVNTRTVHNQMYRAMKALADYFERNPLE